MAATAAAFAEENPLETMTIQLGNRSMDVAVARTPQQWDRGLVGHPDIDAMLFIMPSGSRWPFHMRDVDRDLFIAFFDDRGRVVDLGVLHAWVGFKQPQRSYTYALEFPASTDLSIFEDLARGLSL